MITDKFDLIYQETYESVSKYVILNCRNLADANDVIQNVYYDILKNIDSIKNNKAYIMKIAKNKVSDYYRSNYKSKLVSLFNSDDEIIETICDKVDLEKSVENKYDIDKVWNYLKRKPEKIFKIFYLYYYEEYKINEISKMLKISQSNVKNYLYRTLKELNKYMEE